MLLKAERERNIKELLVQTTQVRYKRRVDRLVKGGRRQSLRLVLVRMVQTRPDIPLDEVPSVFPLSHLDLSHSDVAVASSIGITHAVDQLPLQSHLRDSCYVITTVTRSGADWVLQQPRSDLV